MSHHYSASQFDHAFKPIRLNVYNPFTNMPCPPHGIHSMCLPTRCSATKIIADNNGKLFDWICRGPSSPWGDYSTNIFDKPYCCSCVPELRRPEELCCDPPPQAQKCIFVAKCKEVKKCKCFCEQPAFRLGRDDRGCCCKHPSAKIKNIICNKYKRCRRKEAQVCKKREIDRCFNLKRDQIWAKANQPSKCVDWNALRKFRCQPTLKKRSYRPLCPMLNSCCWTQQPGQAAYCCCLENDNYIRRY